jgi:hypothetical protein
MWLAGPDLTKDRFNLRTNVRSSTDGTSAARPHYRCMPDCLALEPDEHRAKSGGRARGVLPRTIQDFPTGLGGSSRSPSPIVSRHVTIPDVAPSLPGRVTHLRVTLPPPKGEQDTIRRTGVFVNSGSLGKRRLGSPGPRRSDPPAGKRNGHDDHSNLRCFLHLDWAGTFHDTQGCPDQNLKYRSSSTARIRFPRAIVS